MASPAFRLRRDHNSGIRANWAKLWRACTTRGPRASMYFMNFFYASTRLTCLLITIFIAHQHATHSERDTRLANPAVLSVCLSVRQLHTNAPTYDFYLRELLRSELTYFYLNECTFVKLVSRLVWHDPVPVAGHLSEGSLTEM